MNRRTEYFVDASRFLWEYVRTTGKNGDNIFSVYKNTDSISETGGLIAIARRLDLLAMSPPPPLLF